MCFDSALDGGRVDNQIHGDYQRYSDCQIAGNWAPTNMNTVMQTSSEMQQKQLGKALGIT